jgi:uncharacterized protein (DUF2132 family)
MLQSHQSNASSSHYVRKTQWRRAERRTETYRVLYYKVIRDACQDVSPIMIHLKRALGRARLPLQINPRRILRMRVTDLITN